MRTLFLTLILTLAAPIGWAGLPQSGTVPGADTQHGGGCRRDSGPGQCCHMDNSAGSVHCH